MPSKSLWPCRVCFRPLFWERDSLFLEYSPQPHPPPHTHTPLNQVSFFTGSLCSSVRSAHSGAVDIWNVRTFTLLMCGRSELPYRQAHSWTGHMYYSSWDVYRGQCTWLCQRSVNTCTKLLRCLKQGLLLGLGGPGAMTGWTGSNEELCKHPRQPLKMYEGAKSLWPGSSRHPQLQPPPPPPPTSNNRSRIHLPIHSCHLSAPHHCHLHQLGRERSDCHTFHHQLIVMLLPLMFPVQPAISVTGAQ